MIHTEFVRVRNSRRIPPGIVLAPILALALAGCKVGPDYHPPQTSLPTGFTSQIATAETNAAPAEALAHWWTLFKDPQLDGLINEAATANHDLRLAQARVQEARALRGMTRSSLFPQLNASGAYQRSRTSANTIQGEQLQKIGLPLTQDNFNAGFDMNWEIDVFGGNLRSLEAAQAGLESAQEVVNGTLVSVMAEVGLAYIDLRGLQKQLAVANDNLHAQEEVLKLTRDRYQAGLSSELDSTRAQAQVAATAALIPPLEQAIQTTEHRLAVLLGKTPGELNDQLAKAEPIPSAAAMVPVGLPSDLLRRRPDIRRAERDLAASTARIGVATAELFPKFYLTGVAQLQSIEAKDFFDGGSRYWSLGPTFRWPIFEAGRIRQNIKVENARQEQAAIRYEKTVLTSLEETENALVAYGKEQERHRALVESETASQRAVTLATDQFRSGLVDFLNVLEAERSLYASQNELAVSERTLSQNAIRLFKALGGGWPAPEADQSSTSDKQTAAKSDRQIANR